MSNIIRLSPEGLRTEKNLINTNLEEIRQQVLEHEKIFEELSQSSYMSGISDAMRTVIEKVKTAEVNLTSKWNEFTRIIDNATNAAEELKVKHTRAFTDIANNFETKEDFFTAQSREQMASAAAGFAGGAVVGSSVASDSAMSKSTNTLLETVISKRNDFSTITSSEIMAATPVSNYNSVAEAMDARHDALAEIYAGKTTIGLHGEQISYKFMTDADYTAAGYNVDILRANALDINPMSYVSQYGEVPKYVVPYDLGHTTDYTTTIATPDSLAKTAATNASFGF